MYNSTKSLKFSIIYVCFQIFCTEMTSVAFVTLVPYKYKSGENEEISRFLSLYKGLPQVPGISIRIILQPNIRLARNVHFILRVKTAAFPDWTDVARVLRLSATGTYKYRYEVISVFPDAVNKKVNRKSLQIGVELKWKNEPNSSKYHFDYPPDATFELWSQQNGNLIDKIGLCQKLDPTGDYKTRWHVIEVFQNGAGTTIAGVRLPSKAGVLPVPALLQWKSATGPKNWTFVVAGVAEHVQNIANITTDEKNKWESPEATIPVTVLPLLIWESASQHKVKIPYGTFRNSLLHDSTTLEILNNCTTPYGRSQVYVHITDPDTQSLRVCTHRDLSPETEDSEHTDTDIYQAYKQYITTHYNQTSVYPALISTFFKFTMNQLAMNRLFILNKTLNSIVHKHLPGSAYFSECNTVLHYDSTYWMSLKFSRNHNEIMPLIRVLVDQKLDILIRDGALQTAIPIRMTKYEAMESSLIHDLISNKDHIKSRKNKDFFIWLQQCPQVMLMPLDWAHHVSAAISRHLQSGEAKQSLNGWLSCLWKCYNPIELYALEQNPTNVCNMFKSFCQSYEDTIKRDNIRSSIQNAMTQLNKIEFKTRTTLTWKQCQEAAHECGRACVAHILRWIELDEKKKPPVLNIEEENNNY